MQISIPIWHQGQSETAIYKHLGKADISGKYRLFFSMPIDIIDRFVSATTGLVGETVTIDQWGFHIEGGGSKGGQGYIDVRITKANGQLPPTSGKTAVVPVTVLIAMGLALALGLTGVLLLSRIEKVVEIPAVGIIGVGAVLLLLTRR